MDPDSCPEGFANDFTMSAFGSGDACGTKMSVFWGVVGVSLQFRSVLLIIQLWLVRRVQFSRSKDQGFQGKSKRIPLTTIAETIHTMFNLIGWILFGMNLASAKNGIGPMVYFIVVCPMYIGFGLSCLKMVHLGVKLVPRKYRGDNQSDSRLISVRADPLMFLCFVGYYVSLGVAFICMVILNPIIGKGTTDVYTRCGAVFLAIVNISGAFIIARQTEKVAGHIQIVKEKVQDLVKQKENEHNSFKDLERVIRRLKLRSASFILAISILVILNLIAGIRTDYYGWEMVLATLWGSMFTSAASTLVYMPSGKKPTENNAANSPVNKRIENPSSNSNSKSKSIGVVSPLESSILCDKSVLAPTTQVQTAFDAN